MLVRTYHSNTSLEIITGAKTVGKCFRPQSDDWLSAKHFIAEFFFFSFSFFYVFDSFAICSFANLNRSLPGGASLMTILTFCPFLLFYFSDVTLTPR